MRREVTTHPAYKHDSNVSQEIAYDVLSVRLHAGVCGASDDNDRSDAVFQCVPLSVFGNRGRGGVGVGESTIVPSFFEQAERTQGRGCRSHFRKRKGLALSLEL